MDTMQIVQLLLMAAIGAISSMLANAGIAVFNDGLRPVMPEFLEGEMTRAELAAISFSVSFGLVVGFGIPVSIGTTVILAHSILLMSDIIGTWAPSGTKGLAISGALGAVWGAGITFGLEAIVDLFALLPVNFLDALGAVGTPIVIAFAVFPAIAVARQHGFRPGALTFILTTLVWFITTRFGTFQISETATISLSAPGMALLAGMILLIYYAVAVKPDELSDDSQQLVGIFSDRVERIKSNQWYFAVAGGLITVAAAMGIMAGDPISLNLVSEGQWIEAAMTAFTRGIGFIPLVFTTAITTGVFTPAGTTMIYAAGFLLNQWPIVALVVGIAIMLIEVNLLNASAKALDKYPGVRDMGEHIRSSMNDVLEVALLVGGAMASEQIAPGVGFLWVFGAYLLNKQAPRPIVDLAVGPVAAIALGILVNILYVIGLYVPAV